MSTVQVQVGRQLADEIDRSGAVLVVMVTLVGRSSHPGSLCVLLVLCVLHAVMGIYVA